MRFFLKCVSGGVFLLLFSVWGQPAQAQGVVLPGLPSLDLSLLDLDTDLLEPVLATLDPAVSGLASCTPSSCVDILSALAGQTANGQQAVASALSATSIQNAQQLSDFALSSTVYEGAIGAFGTAAAMRSLTPTVATFGISSVAYTDHDGFEARAGGTNIGRTPEFDSVDVGATLGLRFDASKAFNLPRETLTFGAFGNYTNTDIDFSSNRALRQLGIAHTGDADLNSGSAGGYGLLTNGRLYALALASGEFGDATVHNDVLGTRSDFDTSGMSSTLAGGMVMPAWSDAKLDLRGGLNYFSIETDRHRDSAGLRYSEGEVEYFSGTLSARVFTTRTIRNATVRPFLQGGVDYRFDYDNEIRVEGVKFTFDEAPTTLFGRAGMDIEVGQYTQAYVAVRGDHNDDFDAIAGQIGLTFKLN